MNNNKLIVKTSTGKEITFDIVAMITNDVGDKNMVFFTDNKIDEQGNKIIYPSYYTVENGEIKLLTDMTDEDFNHLKDVFEILKYSEDESDLNQNVENSKVVNNPYTDIEVL